MASSRDVVAIPAASADNGVGGIASSPLVGRPGTSTSNFTIETTDWQSTVQEHLRRLNDRASFTEAMQRKRAAKMLFAGSISGLLGFLFAFLIGIIKEQTVGQRDLLGREFPSGRGYFPSTVSEMVHDPQKPAGKCFFAFCFVGANFIFFSWYPTQLRNVYIGDDATMCFGMSWVTFRQFVPAPGMMLLSIVTTVPAAQATLTDNFCIMLHLTGAFMLFVGYFVAEAHAIGWGCFRGKLPSVKARDSPKSITQRKLCLNVIGFFYLIFCVLQVVLVDPTMIGIPKDHLDQYGHYKGYSGLHLTDTAAWDVKSIKIASYASEVICGVALIFSHLVIWFNCEERHYDLPEELRTLHGHFHEKVHVCCDDEADSEQDGADSEGEDSDEASDNAFVDGRR